VFKGGQASQKVIITTMRTSPMPPVGVIMSHAIFLRRRVAPDNRIAPIHGRHRVLVAQVFTKMPDKVATLVGPGAAPEVLQEI